MVDKASAVSKKIIQLTSAFPPFCSGAIIHIMVDIMANVKPDLGQMGKPTLPLARAADLAFELTSWMEEKKIGRKKEKPL
jgi:hypothetical protein